MKAFFRNPLRVTGRLVWFAAEILVFLLDYLVHIALRPGIPLTRARAQWLQASCRRTLRVVGVKTRTSGPIPTRGLIVSNHLSYLDILVLSAITPSVFVSKSEVKHWPVFGMFARLSGTLFLQRTRRSDVARLNRQIAAVLDTGVPVVLFPEGTSSDGSHVLPFKSSLLEPATGQEHPVSVSCIRYSLRDGNPAEDVCYWGDMTLLPHLVNFLSKRRVRAHVTFAPIERSPSCRKELARHLHAEIARMNDGETAAAHT
jgi:1-acyl-sn-glycerol-3-phosphate acyltransferase